MFNLPRIDAKCTKKAQCKSYKETYDGCETALTLGRGVEGTYSGTNSPLETTPAIVTMTLDSDFKYSERMLLMKKSSHPFDLTLLSKTVNLAVLWR